MARDGWKQSLFEFIGQNGLTLFILFLLIIFSSFPLRTQAFGDIRPYFILTTVFYWTIYRPHLLRAWGVFLVGLLLDLLCGLPPGLNALTFLCVQTLVSSQQKFLLAQTYPVVWACFALLAFLSGLFQWGALSLLSLNAFTIKPTLINALLTALLYPLVTFPLYFLLRAIDKRSLFR